MDKTKYAIERLKEIHPDMKDYRYDEDGFFEIILESGEVMSSSEFKADSETRKLMQELEWIRVNSSQVCYNTTINKERERR